MEEEGAGVELEARSFAVEGVGVVAEGEREVLVLLMASKLVVMMGEYLAGSVVDGRVVEG